MDTSTTTAASMEEPIDSELERLATQLSWMIFEATRGLTNTEVSEVFVKITFNEMEYRNVPKPTKLTFTYHSPSLIRYRLRELGPLEKEARPIKRPSIA
jgi:hypothetical protein